MRKLQHLEGLRGFAALIVVFHHYACFLYPALIFGFVGARTHHGIEKYVYGTPLDLLVAGNFSVCIFFVLSGFVLSHKFFLTSDHNVIVSSASRRYLRLGIPVFVIVMAAYILMKLNLFTTEPVAQLTGSTMWLSNMWNFPAHFFDALRQALYGVFFTDVTNFYDNVLWTMKFEFLGSFLVFLFISLFGKLPRRWIAYICFGIIFWRTYYLAFILGVALSDYYAHHHQSDNNLRKKIVLGLYLVVGLILGAFPIPTNTPTIFTSAHLLGNLTYNDYFIISHVIGAFLVLIAVVKSGTLQRFFTLKPNLFLGKVSFSLYLVHMLVLGTYSTLCFKLLANKVPYSLAAIICFTLSLIIILLLSDIFARYVDEPTIKASAAFYRSFIKKQTQLELPIPRKLPSIISRFATSQGDQVTTQESRL